MMPACIFTRRPLPGDEQADQAAARVWTILKAEPRFSIKDTRVTGRTFSEKSSALRRRAW
jgi:hypothetical protein